MMIDYFKLARSRYADFTGRSRRGEYWYFLLVIFIVSFLIRTLNGLFEAHVLKSVVSMLYVTGLSGWWLSIGLTGIGSLLLVYWFVLDSEPGTNKYGPNPKTGATDEVMRHLVD